MKPTIRWLSFSQVWACAIDTSGGRGAFGYGATPAEAYWEWWRYDQRLTR